MNRPRLELPHDARTNIPTTYGEIEVTTSDIPGLDRPILMSTGAMLIGLSTDTAEALGRALLVASAARREAMHKHQAAASEVPA